MKNGIGLCPHNPQFEPVQFKIDPDISKAETLPGSFYSDREVFEQLKDRVFSRSWHFLEGPGSMKNGSAKPFFLLSQYLDEPILVTKDSRGNLNCISNVCTHRGNLLLESEKECQKLVCGYHGRRFDLEGRFEHMPEFEVAQGFPRKNENLEKHKLEMWGDLFFSSLEPAFDIQEVFKQVENRIGFLNPDKFKFDKERSVDYHLDANWALYCDNFLEGFHIPFVHKGLNQVLDYPNYSIELGQFHNVQVGISKDQKDCFSLPEGHIDHGKNVAAYYFWIFPNLMLNFYPWGLSLNVVEPVDIAKTRIRFLTFVGDQERVRSGAGNDLNRVELEDEEVVLSVQKGIRSRSYISGRFSPTKEQGVHQFHLLISKFLNMD